MRGKRMPEGVGADLLGQACLAYGHLDGFVDDTGVDVMPARDAGTGVDREVTRGKDVLPTPLSAGLRILVGQRVRQIDLPVTLGQILIVQGLDFAEVVLKKGNQTDRKGGNPVFVSFAGTHRDLFQPEIYVLDAKT